MAGFPRVEVGGVSVSRMIVGTNWLLGWSHTSFAKDNFLKAYQTRERVAEVLAAFLQAGVDTVMGPPNDLLVAAVKDAEQKTGKKAILILTPGFKIPPAWPELAGPEEAMDQCKQMGATFCMPHQMVTDALLDTRVGAIRDIDKYTKMIRQRGMVPGLSTHRPETLVIADKTGADVESYIQIYNADGFLMPLEVDWVLRIIKEAKKPVMTIKPLAAGRLLPPVGLAFVWSTIRDCDMVTVGCTTADEAREVIELSLDFINKRMPSNVLQKTRSKKALDR